MGTDVAENLEGEVVFLGERAGFVRNLRGDGHQAGAAFADGVVVLLQGLRDALQAAVDTARRRGQLADDTSVGAAADVLALLAYGINLRCRAGEDAAALRHSVAAALAPLEPPARRGKD